MLEVTFFENGSGKKSFFSSVYKGPQPSVHLLQESQHFFSFPMLWFALFLKSKLSFPPLGDKERAAGKREGKLG